MKNGINLDISLNYMYFRDADKGYKDGDFDNKIAANEALIATLLTEEDVLEESGDLAGSIAKKQEALKLKMTTQLSMNRNDFLTKRFNAVLEMEKGLSRLQSFQATYPDVNAENEIGAEDITAIENIVGQKEGLRPVI